MIVVVLKRQRFEDNKSEKSELKVSKCQCASEHDNKEEQSLDKYEGECKGKDIEYVPLPFIAPSLPP